VATIVDIHRRLENNSAMQLASEPQCQRTTQVTALIGTHIRMVMRPGTCSHKQATLDAKFLNHNVRGHDEYGSVLQTKCSCEFPDNEQARVPNSRLKIAHVSISSKSSDVVTLLKIIQSPPWSGVSFPREELRVKGLQPSRLDSLLSQT